MVQGDISDVALIFDIYLLLPLSALTVAILALRFFRRRKSFARFFVFGLSVSVLVYVFYWWILYRHENLLLSQNYSRKHTFRCDPSVVIPEGKRRHFVLSNYKEGTQWTQCPEYAGKVEVTVYDKFNRSGEHFLENVGYECTPYLHYIIDNYGNLPDYVYFLHANPFEHCPNFGNALRGIDVYPFVYLSRVHQNFWTTGEPQHPPRHGFAPVFARIWSELFPDVTMPRYGSSYFNGQFAVRRERILAHPRGYYERMLYIVEDGRDRDAFSWGRRGDGWLECVVMERIWSQVFGEGTIDIAYYDPTVIPVC